jgi:hypothetical protein
MGKDEWAIGLAGLAATLTSTYFGYVAVRERLRRREAVPAPPPQPQDTHDVFVSYAAAGAPLGVLLFGPGTMADASFVPARTGDVALPGFAAIRQPVELTEPGSARYAAEVARPADIVARLRRGTGA